MKKTKTNNLTVRALTEKDAFLYYKIATNEPEMRKFTPFFIVTDIQDAQDKIRSYTNRYEKMYGLFNKANRLVAVFDVSDDCIPNGASVHYFVGKKYRGQNLAYTGILKLADLLAHKYEHFKFVVNNHNFASSGVQRKLGSVQLTEEKDLGYTTFMYKTLSC